MRAILKKSIFTLAGFLFYFGTHTQAQELIGKLYQTKVPILVRNVYPAERLGIPVSWADSVRFEKNTPGDWPDSANNENGLVAVTNHLKYCQAKKGYIFQVIGLDSNKVLIRWWDFTDLSIARQKENEKQRDPNDIEPISYKNTRHDYEISLADLNSKCSPYYGNDNSFIWGAVTMPIKLRFGNRSDRYFSFQESLNIGIAAGWNWQKQGVHQKSENVLFSLGVSNVALDSLDFKKNSKGESFKPNVKSTAAVTVSGGYVFQFDNFQVGAFIGLDILPYELGRQWLNRGKPWVGIGLGMSLFNRDHATAGEGKNKE